MGTTTAGPQIPRAPNPRCDGPTPLKNPNHNFRSQQIAGMYHEQLPYRRVSPKLIVLRQIYNALGFGIPIIAVMIGMSILHATTEFFTRFALAPLLYAVPAALLVTGIVFVFIIPRQVKALGYLENRDDLLLRRGILFRHQVAVPYGRIQYVDIRQGPLQRAYGITQIVITTAGGGTAATFEGLPLEEAERLRDDLTQRGYQRLAELGAS
ncbi:MAG TPA: PH domain-containing protein [Enteractinococcus helveticum]|uniref:PH domain-containing protein n=1 Tax=Enteractinococcus helveticum TaxID=1837282 RepID=A0A921FNC9_9MICC|nr:PH domain-containing protein [Enteractinococcus helveticum]HJF15330.1 PH domain-containing protein [Enteractinococcus helveticum]